jgi:hypothetical protein
MGSPQAQRQGAKAEGGSNDKPDFSHGATMGTRVCMPLAGVGFLSHSSPSTLHLMHEPAENSDATVRRIGRPFPPGQSGNPGGRPKGVARAFRDVLGGSPTEAAQGLQQIARYGKRDADRIAAWRELLDRGWGKAPAFASIEGADPLEHDEIAQEITAIAEQLERERDAR